jgi:hypothetical protein
MKTFLENSYKNKRLIDRKNENLSCVEIISIRPIKPRLQNETLKTIYYEKFLYVENDLVTIQKEVLQPLHPCVVKAVIKAPALLVGYILGVIATKMCFLQIQEVLKC